MKVKLTGGATLAGPHGAMVTYAADEMVDIDDDDEIAVRYWTERVDAGAATVVKTKTTKS